MGGQHATRTESAIDLCALSGARALRRAGYSDERITRIFGSLPPLDMTLDEVIAHNALVRQPPKVTGLDDEGSFQGDV